MKINNLLFTTLILIALSITSCKNNSDKSNDANNSKSEETSIVKIKAKVVKPADFNHYINISGNVEAQQYAYISPQTNGQITHIYVHEGDFVQQGTLLIQLNDNIIKNTIAEVKNSLNLATITYNKQKDLWEQKIGSEIQFLQAQNQKEALEKKLKTLNSQLELSQIRAPFSGYVDNISLNEGELASPGMKLLELVNLNKMRIKADVSEKYLSKISLGDTVDITFPYFPNLKLKEKVSRIGNIVNPNNRTFTIDVKFDNKKQIIKPNVIASLKLRDEHIKNALFVPSIIIKNDFEKQFLFVAAKIDNKYIAKKIVVKTGITYKDQTVITDGLNPGDLIITEGFNLVSDGYNVQLVK